jgi:invasion protein IalB
VDLAQRRSSLPGASFAPWLLAALLSLNAPAPALAQASQAAPGQAPTGQAPAAPKTAAANPQSQDGKEFQDWTLHCKTITQGQPEACEMRQNIVNKQGARVVLVIVGRVPHMEMPGMLILMPLGIALPPGVFLKVDDGDRQQVQLKICEKEGCRVEMVLTSDLVAQLKAGTKATVTFYVYNREGKEQEVNIPVSLLGFSAALAEVMKSPS